MSDLKNQIFALLKKCPERITINKYGIEIAYYPEKFITYVLSLRNDDEYNVNVHIYSDADTFEKEVLLTEKEYMDIKWAAEDWRKVIEEKVFEDFAKFAESEPNSMDDLLND